MAIMKRRTFDLVLDCLMALLVLGLVGTGIVIRFALPPGSGESRFLWGLHRHQWGDVHFWLALAAGVSMLLHVATHWSWVVSFFAVKRQDSERQRAPQASRAFSGLAVLTVLTGLILGFWQLSIRQVTGPQGNRTGFQQPLNGVGTTHIQGSMTRGEVSHATGLPVDEVRLRLGLTDGVGEGEKIGELLHAYGLTMRNARERLTVPAQAGTAGGPVTR
jgi:NADH:ubiquinone oxidoreductase subunit 5 (subunit L)/multisubunit Na+/H+ antiporter MnhA subunit